MHKQPKITRTASQTVAPLHRDTRIGSLLHDKCESVANLSKTGREHSRVPQQTKKVHVEQAVFFRAAIHRVSVDGPPGTDQTALMLAALANHVDALKVLVNNGADVSLPCKLRWADNRTAQGLAELENCRKAAAYLASLPPQ